ncbi:MAG: flagellar filament capping protein FliD [Janthinobacterium lividum]
MGSTSALNSLLGSSSTSSSSSVNLSTLLQASTGSSSSGIDVSAAVAAAVYAAQAPERQWQAQQASVKSQITALTTIQTTLSQLKTDLNDLNNLQGSLSARAVSSSSASVTATATSAATVGSHSVAVQNLATTASWYSRAVASSNAGLGTSTLTITSAGGTATTFATGSGTNSITSLAAAINASSAGVQANVVTDATGARLSLVSSATGAAADFSVSYGTTGASAWSSTSVANASTALPASTFQVGDGSSTANITVNAGDTLATVANSINAQGLGISASVVSDASGAHLAISPTGGGSVSVSADPAFGLTRAASAVNANLTVDGIPLSNASNTVTGAVAGLTINLQGTTGGGSPTSLAVQADTSSISNALANFVTDYNTAVSQVSSQFTYSSASSSQGALSGDSTTRALQSTLLGIASYTAPGGAAGSGAITSLAGLGITMNDDGSLSMNTATLNTALAKPDAVQNFFQGASLNGFAQSFSNQIDSYNSAATGSVTNKLKNLNLQYTSLQTQVDDYETGYISNQKTVLTAMYSKAEIALQSLPAQLKQIQAELNPNSGS